MTEKIVISLGGSVFYKDAFDSAYVHSFGKLLSQYVSRFQFFIITGGGKLAREYISAISGDDDAKDLAGIQATRENAQSVQRILAEHIRVHSAIPLNPYVDKTITECIVMGGWKPGISTDAVAAELASHVGAKVVINASNIDYAYTKDPKLAGAEKLEQISWVEFTKVVGTERVPGGNYPFDPVATKLATGYGLTVVILNGKKLDVLEKAFNGDYVGTVVE